MSEAEHRDVVAAVRRALEACAVGDVPDYAEGIVVLLAMDGWEIARPAGWGEGGKDE